MNTLPKKIQVFIDICIDNPVLVLALVCMYSPSERYPSGCNSLLIVINCAVILMKTLQKA